MTVALSPDRLPLGYTIWHPVICGTPDTHRTAPLADPAVSGPVCR